MVMPSVIHGRNHCLSKGHQEFSSFLLISSIVSLLHLRLGPLLK